MVSLSINVEMIIASVRLLKEEINSISSDSHPLYPRDTNIEINNSKFYI